VARASQLFCDVAALLCLKSSTIIWFDTFVRLVSCRPLGLNAPEGRFKEREMILRFFAFANRLPNYTGNLKRFLNEYIGQYAPKEPQDLKTHASLFKQTMQNIYAVFGEKSARLYETNPRSNKGAWDTKFSVT
jgi:hypothetical protein